MRSFEWGFNPNSIPHRKRDASDVGLQRKDYVRTQQEDSHLQATEREASGEQKSNILTLDFQPPELGEINSCCLHHPVCGITVIVAHNKKYILGLCPGFQTQDT